MPGILGAWFLTQSVLFSIPGAVRSFCHGKTGAGILGRSLFAGMQDRFPGVVRCQAVVIVFSSTPQHQAHP